MYELASDNHSGDTLASITEQVFKFGVLASQGVLRE